MLKVGLGVGLEGERVGTGKGREGVKGRGRGKRFGGERRGGGGA